MESNELQLCEEYFLDTKEKAISKLIKGTDSYNYFYFLQLLSTQGLRLSADQEKQLIEYSFKFKTQRAENIKLRHLFIQYDQQGENQKEIVNKINNELFRQQFSHSQPSKVKASGALKTQVKENPSVLSEVGLDKLVEKCYKDEQVLIYLSPAYYYKLDLDKMVGLEPKFFQRFLSTVGDQIVEMNNIPQILSKFYSNMMGRNKKFEYDPTLYSILSLQQLEECQRLIPSLRNSQSFIGQLFLKKFQVDFHEKREIKTQEDKEERKRILNEMYKWALELPPLYESLSDQILYELLQIGAETNEYNFDLFFVYLKNPKTIYNYCTENQRNDYSNRKKQYQAFWHQYHNLNTSRWFSDTQLIENYLQKYFESNDDFTIFEQFLERSFLIRILTKVQLYKGKEVENVTSVFQGNQLKNMADEKLIEICKFNKKFFKHGEDVKLYIELKNVSKLAVKIFEFSCENYYLKNHSELNSQMNLDGLIATQEQVFEYSDAPIVKKIQEFTFKAIAERERGVFIVEFIGGGLSSRAIIRKGKLFLREKMNVAGHVFQILNENLEVCQGKHTGLWIQNKWYESDNQRHEILVPFPDNNQNLPIVVVHDDFAELTNIQLYKEQFDFQCSYLYCAEQMLMSSKAKILIQPKLYLYNIPASFKLLSEFQVQVVLLNDADIPSSLTFDKIQPTPTDEIEVEFPIGAKIKMVTLNVSAKISDKNQVSSAHQIQFNNYRGENIFCAQFLRYTEDKGYQIYLLGKNGESKAAIDIEIQYQYKGYRQKQIAVLTTDNEGKVDLGKLQDVEQLNSQVRDQIDIKAHPQTWNLNQQRLNYPNVLKIVEGDQLNLPYLGDKATSDEISFVEKFHGQSNHTNIQSKLSQLKLNNKTLVFEGLKKGNYELHLKQIDTRIQIQVLEGKYWKNTELIVMKDEMIDLKKQRNQLVIQNVDKQYSDGNIKVTVEIVTDNYQNTRVHAFATQFLTDRNQLSQQVLMNLRQEEESSISIALHNNTYLSNKKLSDEQKYVLDRQNQERYVGNTLEKPPILLKRQFLRDTSLADEQLDQEGQWKEQAKEGQILKKKMAAKHHGVMHKAAIQQYGGDSFLNFLQHPCLCLANLKTNKDGKVEFTLPNNKYSNVIIIATNSNNVAQELVPFKSFQFQTRDLAQKSSLKKDKFYSIFRNDKKLEKGQKLAIADLTSTELQVIDSIPKLFVLLKELRHCEGTDHEQDKGFDYWDFLPKWNSLSIHEKHLKFDEYVCDELNIFLFFKDRAFYETYVRTYIQNKIEKTFVDYFLQENEAKLLQYTQVNKLQQLNPMEKAMLVIYLNEINPKHKSIAKEIAAYMENQNKLQQVDLKIYKRLFDTVLDAKTAEGQATQTESLASYTQAYQAPPQADMMMMNMMPMQQFGAPPPQAAMRCAAPRMMVQERAMPRQQFQQCLMVGMNSKNMEMEECLYDQDEYEEELNDDYYVEKRKQIQQGYKNAEKTKEYCEKHYEKNNSSQNLVKMNGFWVELANFSISNGVIEGESFLSQKFIHCNRNHTEMIGVLTFMGLPFESPSHQYSPYQGKGLEITAVDNCLIFFKEIKEGNADIKVDILAAQRFFDPRNRYQYSDEDPSIQIEQDVDEYLVNRIYGCQVIVTNCSITRYDFQVLVEVPEGSIPVNTIDYTKNYNITLDPYTTKTFEYFFYFPSVGQYGVYPANVARFGQVVAVAKETQFKVVIEKTSSNLEVMDEILSKGTKEDILNFIQNKNILNSKIFSFNDIYYLLKDKEFYLKLVQILRTKKVFDYNVWSYSIYHCDHESFKEFINCEKNSHIINKFKYFQCSLFETPTLRFLEYYPLITSRVHQLSQDKSNILNVQFKEQYKNFMQYLIEKQDKVDITDKLVFIYYLLLQERINEAIKIYSTIKEQPTGEAALQYDYFTAYLDFYIGYPNFIKAREVCEKYLDYPVIRWRNLFYEIVNQLSEYDGDVQPDAQKQVQEQSAQKKNQEGADKEETLAMEVDGHKLLVSFTNVESVKVHLYKIDLEVLHSRNPFLSQGVEDFAFILPNHTFSVALTKSNMYIESIQQYFHHSLSKQVIEIPKEFRSNNLFVQLNSKSKKVTGRYFSTCLKVQLIENFGQIKVQDEKGKYLSKVYVKTFAKEKSGKVVFYKDGYTDLRGRFDYASLNPESLKNVEKFSLFITSDELGSLIREVNPPASLGKYDVEIQLISESWNKRANERKQVQEGEYSKNQTRYTRKR